MKRINIVSTRLFKIQRTLILGIVMTLACLGATAQNRPVEIRDDVAEAEFNGNDYTIFSYTMKDGSFGYYLGLGGYVNIPGTPLAVDGITETCIFLGTTAAEALATLDTIVACFDMESGATRDFPAMLAIGRPLKNDGIAVCSVQKLIFSKSLCFRFVNGDYKTESYITKSTVKSLRTSFKFNMRKELKNNN